MCPARAKLSSIERRMNGRREDVRRRVVSCRGGRRLCMGAQVVRRAKLRSSNFSKIDRNLAEISVSFPFFLAGKFPQPYVALYQTFIKIAPHGEGGEGKIFV